MPDRSSQARGRPLRRVLPAPAQQAPVAAAPAPPPSSRRDVILAACNTCRKQKTKCSGERPSCSRCLQRRSECLYTTQPGETTSQALKRGYRDLRQRTSVHEELFELLRNLPDREADHVFKRIRDGADVNTILNLIRAGNLLLQMAVAPETRFRYEFPYRSEMPDYCIENNPYLDSIIWGAASLYAHQDRQPDVLAAASAAGRAGDYGTEGYESIYLKPFHAAEVVDPRLIDARISRWTSVSNDDALMREMLAVFLRCEYMFTSAFQKDYFLDDLVAKRDEFCSSLLVNIILAYACVCSQRVSNRAEYWNPDTLVYRFLAEAKRIWELEAHEPRITTIQAGILFSVFHNLCGLDEIGQPYRLQAIELAREIRLFDSTVGGRSEKMKRCMSFMAWTLFSWESLVGFSFLFSPLIKEPPNWRLPDPSKEPNWYGEIWLKYPLSTTLSPSYFGYIFRSKCQFRVIMHDFALAAYTEGSQVTVEKAYELRQRLKSCTYYHYLIITIFEPLIDTETNMYQEPSPREIIAESKRHLQTLMRLYYLRHGYDAMDLFLVVPLMLAASECLEAIDEGTTGQDLEVQRSTLILVAKGLYDQRRNHYLAEALFRVIRGRMRPPEVALLRETMNLDDKEWDEKRDMVQAVRSSWPVSVVKKKETVDSQILTNLVENYGHLNVEDTDAPQGLHPRDKQKLWS
ncbi:N-terminal fungal transcription regulatory domain-containing protein [Trichoderma citrinoviride]|uniref:N-terminal fungal transcription regulatory domain-containing protein n=1 Tax=Trichoderma citrinoviride TaxID=58853 RepID=A0A2T4BFW2_9HYPO|nr:N-terminal fungal transcription regulatory domain-containing protein [Trichoderma citrinoviride]PTB68119.1 N-terminal fungal transcription regulatory domain-containing protein [Trichoderma citrinoviride]